MQREPLRERMRGRWHGVLRVLGVPEPFLRDKHGPCPLCGGKDRWRFDDKDGNGTWICGHCGAGDGIGLVIKANGWDFKVAAERIEAVMGDVRPRAAKPRPDVRRQHRAIRDAWVGAGPICNSVKLYLRSRGIEADEGSMLDVRESSNHEMLALLRDANGVPCQLHRTLLTLGGRKANVEQVRLFMPGPIPKGSAVRLMQIEADRGLGIAEGIETALSALYF